MTPRRTPARIETDLRLLLRREELDHAPDRLGRVERVQRREHEVARLGRLQRGLCGLGVAQLADEDDVRVLAEHAAQRLAEALGVEPDLALVDDAAAVGMEDLDRILDRHDVLAARAVDLVEHRRERRRLAGAGRAGDEDEAALLLREPGDAGREMEVVEARDLARDHAERERDRAALPEAVHAEARQARLRVREVEIAALVEELTAARHRDGDRVEHRLELGVAERAEVGCWVSSPSVRMTGGCPTFRWTSLAPAATACRSTALRSMDSSCIGTSRARFRLGDASTPRASRESRRSGGRASRGASLG